MSCYNFVSVYDRGDIMKFKDDITSCVLAAKGSGKSVMLASMASELKSAILIDTIGVYNPRSNYKTAVLPNSFYFMSPDAYLDFIREEHKTPKKAVINFGNFIGDEVTEEADKLFSFIYKNVFDMPVFVDEMADIMPLAGRGSAEFHRFVKNGRNHGNRPVIFATQRPQSVSKQIFDLCDNFYISMQRAPRTIEYVLDVIDRKNDESMKAKIKSLKPRHFLKYDGVNLSDFTVPTYKYAFKQ
jgi:hypothetical protein